jgi:Arc/MetJ family transcription regulator
MARTNVDVDDELIAKAMRLYRLRTKREAIDFALRRLVGERDPYEAALALEGSGWEGDLDELRDADSLA